MYDLLTKSLLNIRKVESVPFGDTVVRKEGMNKWNFHDTSLDGILDIRHAIKTEVDDDRYKNLFTIALASIILQASNMFRNGKCLSYKKNWESKIISRSDVHQLFFDRLDTVIADDVKILASQPVMVSNIDLCCFGDVRRSIEDVPDNTLDLIITSPPYLNSRDYTDIYMLELKVLQLVNSHEDLQKLRKSTLRSHVQVKYSNVNPIENAR